MGGAGVKALLCLAKRVLVTGGLVCLFAVFNSISARAHGEHNLEPFVRMSGVSFFNVHFSKDRLKVNETVTLTGKFRVMNSWPRMLATPELGWIGVLVPGPKLAVRERWVNGKFIQNAFNVDLGELYDFKMILQAREPGRYHVHPMINLSGTGVWLGRRNG